MALVVLLPSVSYVSIRRTLVRRRKEKVDELEVKSIVRGLVPGIFINFGVINHSIVQIQNLRIYIARIEMLSDSKTGGCDIENTMALFGQIIRSV